MHYQNYLPTRLLIRTTVLVVSTLLLLSCETEQQERTFELSADVRIVRDEFGVPHVFAATMADAAFGQGYAQAQDRLLQMDLLRRTALGKQAELLGDEALELDQLVRAINLPAAAQASLEALSDETIDTLDGFVAGINRYLSDLAVGANGAKRTVDLDALDPNYTPPDWQRLDVIAVATAAVFSLSSQIVDDLTLTALYELDGPEIFAELTGFAPLVSSFTLDDPAVDQLIPLPLTGTTITAKSTQTTNQHLAPKINPAISGSSVGIAAALGDLRDTIDQLRFWPGASNNWAVSAKASARGFGLLASDPHGGISVPSSFHEIHLIIEDPAINAYGIAVIGGPMIHIGHNGQAAWAFTNLGADVGDLYIEDISNDGKTATIDGKVVELLNRTEEIKVRGDGDSVANAKTIVLDLQDVPGHGPILNPVLPEPLPLLFGDRNVSYRWVGAGPTLEAQALANLLRTTDWDSYNEIVQDWHTGAQNTVYADDDGNVGYYATGQFPARPWLTQEQPHDSIRPLPSSGHEWDGQNNYADMRSRYNPTWGFVASANADPSGFTADGTLFDDNYLGYAQDYGFRIHRIRQELSRTINDGGTTLADMLALQTDTHMGFADLLAPRYAQSLSQCEIGTQSAADVLRSWDHNAAVDSVGASAFHQITIRLLNDYIVNQVSAPLRPLVFANSQVAFRSLAHNLNLTNAAIWPKGVDHALQDACANAINDLRDFFGSDDTARWQWGELHSRSLDHVLGDDNPAFNVGPRPSAGGFAVVNRSDIAYIDDDGQPSGPYRIVDGADMRFVVELEPGVWSTRVSLPVGSSGDPNSPHYQDQFADWVDGNYRKAHYLPQDVEAAAKSSTLLHPDQK